MHPLAIFGSMIGGIIFGRLGQAIGDKLDSKEELTKTNEGDTVESTNAQTVPDSTTEVEPTTSTLTIKEEPTQ